MNEEEKWLKTKIENAVNENASFRLAEVKEKAVTADESYASPAKKKKSVLSTVVTIVSCAVVALTVASLAASPFIFKNPTATPGDGEKEISASSIEVPYVDPYVEPNEEISDEEIGTYYNPILTAFTEEIIDMKGRTAEAMYVCDFPSDAFPAYKEDGKALAVKISENDSRYSETFYFLIESEYLLNTVFKEETFPVSEYLACDIPNGYEQTYDLIAEFIRTTPLIVCETEVPEEVPEEGFSSIEDALRFVGCPIGNDKVAELVFEFSAKVGPEYSSVTNILVVRTESNRWVFNLTESCKSEVDARFGKYHEGEDWDAIGYGGFSDVYTIPVSELTEDDIRFAANFMVANMSGVVREGSESYEYFLSKELEAYGLPIDSLSVREENGNYRLEARFVGHGDEFFDYAPWYQIASCEIAKESRDELAGVFGSESIKTVNADVYYAVYKTLHELDAGVNTHFEVPYYYDTETANTLIRILSNATEGRGNIEESYCSVIGAEWNEDEPSLLKLKLRRNDLHNMITEAYIKCGFGGKGDPIYFDNTSELDEESINFIADFISGADSMTVFPYMPDVSACNDGKEALNVLIRYLCQFTASEYVDGIRFYTDGYGEYSAFVTVGHKDDLYDNKTDYQFPIDAAVFNKFNKLKEKYGYNGIVDENTCMIDLITVEEVGLISKSYASLKSVLYELNSPVSPIPLPNYDPLTDAVNAITGKKYIAVKSIEMFEIEYDMFFRIDVLDAEGGVTSYYVCGVGNDLFMACASGDDGMIADALMGCELKTYDECEEILSEIRPTEEDGVFAFDTFSFANDSELYKAGDPGVKTEGFVNTRPSGSDLPVSVLLEKAKAECTVEYDTVRIQFDPKSYLFSIDFYVKDVLGGGESVYMDKAGRTWLIVYGE